jgi:hypothetical protein
MNYNYLPVFQLTYKITLEIHKTSHLFPREYRYTLGQKLKTVSAEIMDLIIEANRQSAKYDTLSEALLKAAQLNIHLRLCCDLKILGLKHFELFARQLKEIETQLLGWRDWSKNQSRNTGTNLPCEN